MRWPAYEVAKGRDHYLYYNGHGDLAATADASGTSTGTFTYDPFGAPLQTPPANTTEHLYTGRWNKQYDTSSGLILMGARPYDPATGRFLAVDPVNGGSANNYDYVNCDPINGYDLDGTLPSCDGYTITDKWGDKFRASVLPNGRLSWTTIERGPRWIGTTPTMSVFAWTVAIEGQVEWSGYDLRPRDGKPIKGPPHSSIPATYLPKGAVVDIKYAYSARTPDDAIIGFVGHAECEIK